jgi:hypothetical protein
VGLGAFHFTELVRFSVEKRSLAQHIARHIDFAWLLAKVALESFRGLCVGKRGGAHVIQAAVLQCHVDGGFPELLVGLEIGTGQRLVRGRAFYDPHLLAALLGRLEVPLLRRAVYELNPQILGVDGESLFRG